MTKLEYGCMALYTGLKISNGVNSDCFLGYKDDEYTYTIGEIEEFKLSLKLILHPLSDLTKEIDHNGEKFTPIVRLGWYINLRGWSEVNTRFAIENMSFQDAKQLIEWHFDIAGLIELGEAIDVNTLPINPYK